MVGVLQQSVSRDTAHEYLVILSDIVIFFLANLAHVLQKLSCKENVVRVVDHLDVFMVSKVGTELTEWFFLNRIVLGEFEFLD